MISKALETKEKRNLTSSKLKTFVQRWIQSSEWKGNKWNKQIYFQIILIIKD